MTLRPPSGWCHQCGPAGPFDVGSLLGAKKTVVSLARIELDSWTEITTVDEKGYNWFL